MDEVKVKETRRKWPYGKRRSVREGENRKKKLWGTPVRPNVPTNRVTRRKYDSRRNSCHWRSARQSTQTAATFRQRGDAVVRHATRGRIRCACAKRVSSSARGEGGRERSRAVPRVGEPTAVCRRNVERLRAGALHPPRRVNAPAAWLSRMRCCRCTAGRRRCRVVLDPVQHPLSPLGQTPRGREILPPALLL